MLEEYNITQTTLKIIGLYTDNYKKSIHLREIARETDVDVKSIQLQLKKLERINVLSSIPKGRNKEYTLNLNNVITKYYLIMAEGFISVIYLKKHFLIKKVLEEIGRKIDYPLILFGSFTKGGHTKESDIDLFVISEEKIDKRVTLEASDLVGRDINIKSSNKAQFLNGLRNKDPLVHEVISNHVILKGIDEFCEIMWGYYVS
ncbi:MAG TPA: nucleotidyltransferase domain-containing protein [Nitrosopumilaceae archaeon]|nr:nucleotidyltransferase domain-containing protein [Nitrosopumilaceae archaeon]